MAAPNNISKLRGEGQPARVQDNVGAVLNPLAEAVGNTPIMGAPPPPWIRPDFAAGFADASGFPQTAYHRDALGYAWLKLSASTAAGSAANATVTTLEQGYRPSEQVFFLGVNGSTGALNQVSIDASGVVRSVQAIGAGESVVGYFSFLAEQ